MAWLHSNVSQISTLYWRPKVLKNWKKYKRVWSELQIKSLRTRTVLHLPKMTAAITEAVHEQQNLVLVVQIAFSP